MGEVLKLKGPALLRFSRKQWTNRVARYKERRVQNMSISMDASQNEVCRPNTLLIFGANTDVGKTLVSAGLVRSALIHSEQKYKSEAMDLDGTAYRQRHNRKTTTLVNYTKPLQCGGSDENFVRHVVGHLFEGGAVAHHWHFEAHTLFDWETPSSPHYASRLENLPVNDEEIISALQQNRSNFQLRCAKEHALGVHYIESAGGILSPASASPFNDLPHHAYRRLRAIKDSSNDFPNDGNQRSWGWSTQADLYSALIRDDADQTSVILVGDGKIGGISCTLSALESLVCRGYNVQAVVFLRNDGQDTAKGFVNVEAIQEFLDSRSFSLASPVSRVNQYLLPKAEQGVFSLPPIPPHPEPLNNWYNATTHIFHSINEQLIESG